MLDDSPRKVNEEVFGIDDQIPYNEKFHQCSLAAVGLLVYAGCRSSAQMDDGAVPVWFPATVGADQTMIDELVAAGLWEVSATGWQYVDFLAVNKSREQRLEALENKRQWQENARRRKAIERVRQQRTEDPKPEPRVRPQRTRARPTK